MYRAELPRIDGTNRPRARTTDVNRCDLPFQGGELAVEHAVPGHSLCRAVPYRTPTQTVGRGSLSRLARSAQRRARQARPPDSRQTEIFRLGF
jgi:hypothetical protein